MLVLYELLLCVVLMPTVEGQSELAQRGGKHVNLESNEGNQAMLKHLLITLTCVTTLIAAPISNAGEPTYTVRFRFTGSSASFTAGDESSHFNTPGFDTGPIPVRNHGEVMSAMKESSGNYRAFLSTSAKKHEDGSRDWTRSHTRYNSHHVNETTVNGTVQHNHAHTGTVGVQVEQPRRQCGTYNCHCGVSRPVYRVSHAGRSGYGYQCPVNGWVYSWNSTRWNWNMFRPGALAYGVTSYRGR